jgi:Fe2+ transport system protein FeoA
VCFAAPRLTATTCCLRYAGVDECKLNRLFVIIPIAYRNANHYHFGLNQETTNKIRCLHNFPADFRVAQKTGTTPMDHNGSTLASLRKGQKGVIASVNAADPQVQRLMTLGLVEGAIVELASAALGGDPMEFRLFGRGISLRQEQARQFAVSPVAAGGD